MLAAGCSSTEEAASPPVRFAAPVSKLPAKIPTGPLDAFNTFLEGYDFINGLVACSQPQGCFGDGKDYKLNKKLDAISAQLDALKADVQEGFALTRLDITESNYAAAERDYNTRYGAHINSAMKSLARMSNIELTAKERKVALSNFKRSAQVLMPGSADSAMKDYVSTLAGSGQSLTQGGLLGASWKLITAQLRQAQGDAKGTTPLYLPASSVNLMSDIGTQRLIEGAQLAAILEAYTVLLDPEDYDGDQKAQNDLRRDMREMWLNGIDGAPGAAAITAALPRKLPSQSGAFTSGFGLNKSDGVLIRNFGPVVEPLKRTGPLVNQDSGYSLAPGLDEWLYDTKKAGDPRRELTLSRAGVDWQFDPASKTLSTTLTSDTKLPYIVLLGGKLTSELGAVMAVHPRKLAAGEVVPFVKAGAGTAGQQEWKLDPKRGYISPEGRPDLCMAFSARAARGTQHSGVSGVGGQWSRNFYGIGPRFDNPSVPYSRPNGENLGTDALPRISLKDCSSDPMKQWFLDGPVPQDGLPFSDPAALMDLSPTNIVAVEEDDYPLALWHGLSAADVKKMRTVILERGLKTGALFDLYGSVSTPGMDRSLPPNLHPAMWTAVRYDLSTPLGVRQPTKDLPGPDAVDELFNWTAAVLPVIDAGKKTFYFLGTDSYNVDGTGTAPWITTAAVLAVDIEPCTFVFVTPTSEQFDCDYKNEVEAQIATPATSISQGSALRRDPHGAAPEASASADASPAPSASESPSATATSSPSPLPSEAEQDEASPSSSAGEATPTGTS